MNSLQDQEVIRRELYITKGDNGYIAECGLCGAVEDSEFDDYENRAEYIDIVCSFHACGAL